MIKYKGCHYREAALAQEEIDALNKATGVDKMVVPFVEEFAATAQAIQAMAARWKTEVKTKPINLLMTDIPARARAWWITLHNYNSVLANWCNR